MLVLRRHSIVIGRTSYFAASLISYAFDRRIKLSVPIGIGNPPQIRPKRCNARKIPLKFSKVTR
jgi:hypothetical protein